jgi:hypothetical protein
VSEEPPEVTVTESESQEQPDEEWEKDGVFYGSGQQDNSDSEDPPPPLHQILDLMGAVAEGGNVIQLRQTVAKLYPTNVKDAEKWQLVLNRLRLAAETVASSGTEAFAALLNK